MPLRSFKATVLTHTSSPVKNSFLRLQYQKNGCVQMHISRLLTKMSDREMLVGRGDITCDYLDYYLEGFRLLRTFLLSVAIIGVAGSPVHAETVHPSDGHFLASKRWFVLEDDMAKGIFRSYAGLFMDDKLVDFPNLFMTHCQSGQLPYLTTHFPTRYAFEGFDAATWLPKTNFAVKVTGGIRNMEAELNENEFHVDLGATEFDNISEIWATTGSVSFKVGPEYAGFTVMMADQEFDNMTRNMLRDFGKKVISNFSFLQMRTRCLAINQMDEAARKWKIFGSLECLSCDKESGKTVEFFTMDTAQTGQVMLTEKICEAKKEEIVAALTNPKNGTVIRADLLCIKAQ
jgi:hypothetical protein